MQKNLVKNIFNQKNIYRQLPKNIQIPKNNPLAFNNFNKNMGENYILNNNNILYEINRPKKRVPSYEKDDFNNNNYNFKNFDKINKNNAIIDKPDEIDIINPNNYVKQGLYEYFTTHVIEKINLHEINKFMINRINF